MPRAQKVQAAPQEQYGERQHLEEAQQEQPLPVDPMQAALAMPAPAGVMQQPVDPTLDPNAGLGQAPIVPRAQKMKQADILRMAAQMSGNEQLARLANRSTAGGARQSRGRVPGGTVIRR
jgi:hypothetical protein